MGVLRIKGSIIEIKLSERSEADISSFNKTYYKRKFEVNRREKISTNYMNRCYLIFSTTINAKSVDQRPL